MKAFDCVMCGECCYGEGGIVVDRAETERISRFLGMSRKAFMARFCEERHGKDYIRTGTDNFCAFFDQERACLIHPVKPRICSLWPFFPAIVRDRENWELAKEACPGISRECSFEEFVSQAESREDEK